MHFSRRTIFSTILSSLLPSLLPSFARAQSTSLSKEQQQSFASIYGANGPPPADLSELQTILRFQESIEKINPDMNSIHAYIASRPVMQAATAGILPVLGKLYAWHQMTLEATSLDHTTSTPGNPPPTYGEQFGPPRSSRALAIIHIAMYEAVNAITRRASSYDNCQKDVFSSSGVSPDEVSPETASIDMAIQEAAFNTLRALYPNKEVMFRATYDLLYVTMADGAPKQLGMKIGKAAADAILSRRIGKDNAVPGEPPAPQYDPQHPFEWAADPIVPGKPPLALGANWGRVAPFALTSAAQFRPSTPPPPAGDPAFTKGYDEVHDIGGDPNVTAGAPRWPTPTKRTDGMHLDDTNETFKAIFWAYDGTPALCAPPRLYNMVATSIALRERPITAVDDFARFLALVNIALADAGIGGWEAKYHYGYARPITVLRHVDRQGTIGKGDSHWTPLGAQVTNGAAGSRNLTPPFPSYPSGHAVFGGALFQTLRRFWKLPSDGVPFHFVSDEYNGNNRGPGDSQARDFVNRPFKTFTEAELENAQSRVWMGIHWRWDADEGIAQGRKIADHVFDTVLQPL